MSKFDDIEKEREIALRAAERADHLADRLRTGALSAMTSITTSTFLELQEDMRRLAAIWRTRGMFVGGLDPLFDEPEAPALAPKDGEL